jgi:hypothetical protein
LAIWFSVEVLGNRQILYKNVSTFIWICTSIDFRPEMMYLGHFGTSTENQIAKRQISVKSGQINSWFIYAKKIIWKYNLPEIYLLLEAPYTKAEWKQHFSFIGILSVSLADIVGRNIRRCCFPGLKASTFRYFRYL